MWISSLSLHTGDTLYYRFTSDMSNTEWGYKFTVTAGHLGRFQTGKHCSECIWKDFLQLFCQTCHYLGWVFGYFLTWDLLSSVFWKYVICLIRFETWLMSLICCDFMQEIANLYRDLEKTIIILLAFKVSLYDSNYTQDLVNTPRCHNWKQISF